MLCGKCFELRSFELREALGVGARSPALSTVEVENLLHPKKSELGILTQDDALRVQWIEQAREAKVELAIEAPTEDADDPFPFQMQKSRLQSLARVLRYVFRQYGAPHSTCLRDKERSAFL
jgi:hypothetical protein